MGDYTYKVTAKKRKLNDGTIANVAVFAYKPSFMCGSESYNNRMHFETGCYNAERYVDNSPNFTGLAVYEHEEFQVAVPVSSGTFTDAWFDMRLYEMKNERNQGERNDIK